MSGFTDSLDSFFRISERGSTLRNELRGGLITFLAMAYILVVNPTILGAVPTAADYGFNALFTATALASLIACLLMGLYSRFPVALAPGMGVNAFFSYNICLAMGFTFTQGLLVVLVSGFLFFLITITGFRMKVLDSIPKSMKLAISAGIGFFIALVGLFNGGIIQHANGSALCLGSLSDSGIQLSFICIIITLIIWFRRSWSAVIVGMLATWIIGIIMGVAGFTSTYNPALIPTWAPDTFVSTPDFSLFFAVFTDFKMFDSTLTIAFITAVISLFVVDMFDTAGTLIAVGGSAGLIDEDGNIVDGQRALEADAIGTVAGSICGTSTTTSFIESTTGINAGARTGLMPVVVAIFFGIALIFSGFFGTFTSACTVGALVLVGIMMIKNVKDIEWDDPVTCAMAFLTIFMMGLTGSITDGIAFGLFAWVGGKTLMGKYKEVSTTLWVLTAVFIMYFFINYFVIPNGWL